MQSLTLQCHVASQSVVLRGPQDDLLKINQKVMITIQMKKWNAKNTQKRQQKCKNIILIVISLNN